MDTLSLPFDHEPSVNLPRVRVRLIREGVATYQSTVTSAQDVVRLCNDMVELDREECRVLLLDAKHHVIGVHTVSIGSLTASIVHPREVFKAAILSNAAAIIAVHNHPSGDPTPSPEDRALTKRLHEAGTLLGISLLDHVVIGHQRHYSFADSGQLA